MVFRTETSVSAGRWRRWGSSVMPSAVEPLIARLGDTDSDVRRGAAEALARLGEARAVEPLIARLGDTDSDVRRGAADAGAAR